MKWYWTRRNPRKPHANGGKGENTETPPSLCRWIYERIIESGLRPDVVLDPCSGYGNMGQPFRPTSTVIEFEIELGLDFFQVQPLRCDLVVCNPPWSDAELWLPQIVRVAGRHTPMVFVSNILFFTGYKNAPFRRYLQSPLAPVLNHITPLPCDTFVGADGKGAILWLNLPKVCHVALVPDAYLVRTND